MTDDNLDDGPKFIEFGEYEDLAQRIYEKYPAEYTCTYKLLNEQAAVSFAKYIDKLGQTSIRITYGPFIEKDKLGKEIKKNSLILRITFNDEVLGFDIAQRTNDFRVGAEFTCNLGLVNTKEIKLFTLKKTPKAEEDFSITVEQALNMVARVFKVFVENEDHFPPDKLPDQNVLAILRGE